MSGLNDDRLRRLGPFLVTRLMTTMRCNSCKKFMTIGIGVIRLVYILGLIPWDKSELSEDIVQLTLVSRFVNYPIISMKMSFKVCV